MFSVSVCWGGIKRSVLLFIAFLSLTSEIAAGAEGADLLATVRDARAETFRRMVSGHGVATVESTEERAEWEKPRNSKSEVSFRFSGRHSLAKTVDSLHAGAPVGASLIRDKLHVVYLVRSPANPAVGSVSIEPLRHVPIYSPDIEDWSFPFLAEVPVGGAFEDQELFTRWMKVPIQEITREGDMVRLTIITQPKPEIGLVSHQRVYTFDLSLGGMLVRYSNERVDHDTNAKTKAVEANKVVETWKVTWKREGDAIVPVNRRVEATYSTDDVFRRRRVSTVDFIRFQPAKVEEAELVMDRMGIAVDTRVWEPVEKQTWLYSDAAARQRFASAPPK